MKQTRTSNQWWEGALNMLQAAAKNTLGMLGDHTNMVEVGDLISEGWLRSVRYARTVATRKFQAYYLPTHMQREYFRLIQQWKYTKDRHLQRRLPYEVVLDQETSDLSTDYLDLWECIYRCCNMREVQILKLKELEFSNNEIGTVFGITGERVRQKLLDVRRKLRKGGLTYGQSGED